MKTTTAPATPRTITIDGTIYTYLRTEFNAFIDSKTYIIASPRGQEFTIEPWADKSLGVWRLQGSDRGMAASGTLEMVNGKLIDATDKFRTAKVTQWGWSGQPNYTYHFADGTTLDSVRRAIAA